MNESGNYIDQVVFLENIYKHQKSISQHNPDLIKSPEKQILRLADRFAIQAEAEKNDKFAKPIKKALKILFIMNVMLGITILLIEAF